MHTRFTLRIENRGAILYDRARHAYSRRSAAEAFLMVASREIGVAGARKVLAGRFGQQLADLTYKHLRELGAISARKPFEGRVLEQPNLEGAYAAPLVAHLGLTLACNYACSHCYSSSGQRMKDELTREELLALVNQLHDAGVCKLVLGGGEPFLRRELPEVVRAADRLGIDTYVHTNASVLKPGILAALRDCPPAGLAVSLEGSDAQLNDSVRGPGTFAMTLKGLAMLRKDYPPGFNISITIGPHNVHDAAAMVELAAREEAKVLLLRPAYPAGEATKKTELFCDRDTFTKAVHAAKARAAELGVVVDAPDPTSPGIPSFEGFGCVAARVVLGISPNGAVTPCLNLPKTFETGNVRDSSIGELWRSGRSFVSVRAQQPTDLCRSCKHYDTCRGGCRVRALFAGNGLNGPDAWCHYEPRETQAVS